MSDNHPIPWTTGDILEATGGRFLTGPADHAFNGIAIDSRTIRADDLFVAIAGDTHDGHDFVDAVLKSGVTGVLVDEGKFARVPSGRSTAQTVVITVADTTRALGDMAAYNRRRARISVAALTGSNGKTTTRTMLSRIVSSQYATLSTRGNFNNEIGLPLTLFRLGPKHTWAVLEMGMNRPGEIRRLAEICSPDIGMITNVGPAHLEGLGSLGGVAQAKGELLEKLNTGGKTVLNADDPNVLSLAGKAPGEILLFGTSENAAVRATSIRDTGEQVSFQLEIPGSASEITLNTPGRFMISNALAAASAAYLMGVDLTKIKNGLQSFNPVKGRLSVLTLDSGLRIVDDTYNANPDSMKAALQTLENLRGDGRSAAVLGDMLELGSQSAALHRELGNRVAMTGPARLYVTGGFADSVAQGARQGGMPGDRIMTGSQEELAADLVGWVEPGDWILVKGSRGMRMERIVQQLTNTFGTR